MDKINKAVGSTRLGAWGEQAAAEYLTGLGWQVVARNWRSDGGELDLVALEPVEGGPPVGVVVEVKCRRGTGFGDPLEAITRQKNSRLRRLAAKWWHDYPGPLSGLRLDAVGIVKIPGVRARITHVRGIQ